VIIVTSAIHSQYAQLECSNRWHGWTKPKKVKKHIGAWASEEGQGGQGPPGFWKFQQKNLKNDPIGHPEFQQKKCKKWSN